MEHKVQSIISILTRTDKSEISLAMVEGISEPVVVKRLKNANVSIFQQIIKINSPHLP